MSLRRIWLTIIAVLAATIVAQTPVYSGVAIGSYSHYAHSEDASRCVANSGVTAFDGCLEWDRLVTSCNSYAAASQVTAYFNCYCQQDYLNAIYSCNNEQRRCFGATTIDIDFTADYSSWHSYCDPVVIYTPTTPILSPITASYNIGYCTTAKDACLSMTYTRSSCYLAYQSNSNLAPYRSCMCAPPVLSQEFTCSFLANISCAQVPAHLDHMSGWTSCDNFEQVLTVPPSLTASLGTETTTRWTYYTASSTSATPLRSASYSSPTETTGTENAARASHRGWSGIALLVGGFVAFLVDFA